MSGPLDGRVAIVTGAGRGLGREHALLLAAQGARVVVNDYGGTIDGTGGETSVAQGVVDEIVAAGGQAVANGDSVADWSGAERIVRTALEAFGDLHVVVNNAGIVRDRMLVSLEEDDWDLVLGVHLKGTVAVSRFAAGYWREQAKAGTPTAACIVNTTSGAGLFNVPSQSGYGGAKAATAALTLIWAKELGRYGVRVNAVAPLARTRLGGNTPDLLDLLAPPTDPTGFDRFHPGNVSPVVAYLAEQSCPLTGAVLQVAGGVVDVLSGWDVRASVEKDGRWTVEELASALGPSAAPAADDLLASEATSVDRQMARLSGGERTTWYRPA